MSNNFLKLYDQACPVCKQSVFTLLKKNDRYNMGLTTVGCNHCGLIQTNPRPSESGLSDFYTNEYRKYYQGIISPDDEYIKSLKKEDRMRRLISFLENYIKFSPETSILDIGCSEGVLFNQLRNKKFEGQLYGVEPNTNFSTYAQNKSNALVFATLDEIETTFDLIVLNHVFEHLLEPINYLTNLKKYLKPNGMIYIDVPDAEEYKSLADLHIAHLYHYTIRTLKYALQISGYGVVKCEKHLPVNHPKSIRFLVKYNSSEIIPLRTNLETEKPAWNAIKKIPTCIFISKNLIKKIPFLYLAFKKIRSSFIV